MALFKRKPPPTTRQFKVGKTVPAKVAEQAAQQARVRAAGGGGSLAAQAKRFRAEQAKAAKKAGGDGKK